MLKSKSKLQLRAARSFLNNDKVNPRTDLQIRQKRHYLEEIQTIEKLKKFPSTNFEMKKGKKHVEIKTKG